MIHAFLFFLCLCMIDCSAQHQISQRQEDVDYFSRQLVKKHGNAFHTLTRLEFEQDVDKLRREADSLQPHEFYVRLLQITTKIGDGHTFIPAPVDFKLYPLFLYWFDNELRVIQAGAAYKEAIGKKLVKIEDMSIAVAQERLENTVLSKQQNRWYILSNSPFNIMRPEILHALGIVPSLEHAHFTFADDEGKEITLDINSFSPGNKMEWVKASASEPLFRQQPAETFGLSYLQDINAVYVNFRKYDDLPQHIKKLFALIDEKKATRLIIDFRQNQGGDFNKVRRQLIPKIKQNSILNQKNNLFIISGRRTFSAALANVIDFKKETNATIIGEPPGERPNEWSENDEFTLPNTKWVVSYSTKFYRFLDEDIDAFQPDLRVDPNWKDYKAGIDPVVERIKSLVR